MPVANTSHQVYQHHNNVSFTIANNTLPLQSTTSTITEQHHQCNTEHHQQSGMFNSHHLPNNNAVTITQQHAATMQ